jgi:DNA-binding MarR family transcriptional regulator
MNGTLDRKSFASLERIERWQSNVPWNVGLLHLAGVQQTRMNGILDRKRFASLERIVRGFSNHRRIQIMVLLKQKPDLDLSAIANLCSINLQTAGEHTKRLDAAGLVLKKKMKRQVLHAISPLGRRVLDFLETVP